MLQRYFTRVMLTCRKQPYWPPDLTSYSVQYIRFSHLSCLLIGGETDSLNVTSIFLLTRSDNCMRNYSYPNTEFTCPGQEGLQARLLWVRLASFLVLSLFIGWKSFNVLRLSIKSLNYLPRSPPKQSDLMIKTGKINK